MKLKITLFAVLIGLLTLGSCKKNETPPGVKGVVLELQTYTSGFAINGGFWFETQYSEKQLKEAFPEGGFCFSANPNPTYNPDSILVKIPKYAIADYPSMTVSTDASDLLNKLTPYKTYHIRAFLKNPVYNEFIYTEDKIIRITPMPGDIVTNAPTSVSETTVEIGGVVNNSGYAPLTESGICCSTDSLSMPTVADTKVVMPGASQTINVNVTGLAAGTRYYFRAYATNFRGTGYGNKIEVTTPF